MGLGVMLDVAIGLVFVYLLISLLAMALQEVVAGVLQLRSKLLYSGMWRMLATQGDPPTRTSPRSTDTSGAPAASATGLFQSVWGHDLIKGLSQTSRGPSYIPARTFAAVLVDVLRSGSQAAPMMAIAGSVAALPASSAKNALTTLLADAGGDLDRFKANVSGWFDDSMDRVSGEYKRWAQTFTLVFGLVAAIALNVDTFAVASTLWRDPAAREAVTQGAVQWAKTNAPAEAGSGAKAPAHSAREIAAQVEDLPLPTGWNDGISATLLGDGGLGGASVIHALGVILGWAITGLAVSLGAPFWFDLLQKFMNLRSAGPKPDPA